MMRLVGMWAVLLTCVAGITAQGAEPASNGAISSANLAALGLEGMALVSDEQGVEVRGMGNAAWGGSFAWGFLPALSFSQNYYTATGTTFSRGANTSYAGLGTPTLVGTTFPFFNFGAILTGSGGWAGGGSFAQNN